MNIFAKCSQADSPRHFMRPAGMPSSPVAVFALIRGSARSRASLVICHMSSSLWWLGSSRLPFDAVAAQSPCVGLKRSCM